MIVLLRSRLCIITLPGVASNYLHSRLRGFSELNLSPKVFAPNIITFDRCKDSLTSLLPLHEMTFVVMIRCPLDRAWYYAQNRRVFPKNQVEPKTENDYLLLSEFVVSTWGESKVTPMQSDIVRLHDQLKLFDYSRVELFWQFINRSIIDDYPRFKHRQLKKPVGFSQAHEMSFDMLAPCAKKLLNADYNLYNSAFRKHQR